MSLSFQVPVSIQAPSVGITFSGTCLRIIFSTGILLQDYLVLTYHTVYLLTAWSRVLLEKLTGSQLVKKFHAFYGT